MSNWYYVLPSVLLNMTLTGSVAILAVLFLRLLLKKVTKTVTFLLWVVVLFRLLCPVSFSLPVSLYSLFETEIREESVIEYIPMDIVHTPYPQINLPLPQTVNDAINEELPYGSHQILADPLEYEASLATFIWMKGAVVILLWNVTEYIVLRTRLRKAMKRERGIYETNRLDTAIVTGVFFHRIYLPEGLEEQIRQCVLLHERQHIKRGDSLFKLAFFAALCIHWYNPLVWLAFRLAVRDMEMACDEGVLRHLGQDSRQFYASALLSVAAGRTIRISTPLAFGETDVQKRIRNILDYSKPSGRILLTAVLFLLSATVVLASNPVKEAVEYRVSSLFSEKPVLMDEADLLKDGVDEKYLCAMIESGGGPRVYILDVYRMELPAEEETWYLVGFTMKGAGEGTYSSLHAVGQAQFVRKDGTMKLVGQFRASEHEVVLGNPVVFRWDSIPRREDSFHVFYVLDTSVKELTVLRDGKTHENFRIETVPSMLLIPYEEELVYRVTNESGEQTVYSYFEDFSKQTVEYDRITQFLEKDSSPEEKRRELEKAIRELEEELLRYAENAAQLEQFIQAAETGGVRKEDAPNSSFRIMVAEDVPVTRILELAKGEQSRLNSGRKICEDYLEKYRGFLEELT